MYLRPHTYDQAEVGLLCDIGIATNGLESSVGRLSRGIFTNMGSGSERSDLHSHRSCSSRWFQRSGDQCKPSNETRYRRPRPTVPPYNKAQHTLRRSKLYTAQEQFYYSSRLEPLDNTSSGITGTIRMHNECDKLKDTFSCYQ